MSEPKLPKPPGRLIEAAKRALPEVVWFARNKRMREGQIELSPTRLQMALLDAGHTSAAAVHAIHRLLESGLLERAGQGDGLIRTTDALWERWRAVDSAEETGDQPTHSPDYRSVRWNGIEYSFTTTQAACVEVLWQSWEQGTPDVADATVIERAGASTERLSHVFRKGNEPPPAWNTMIIEGRTKGTHRIADPG